MMQIASATDQEYSTGATLTLVFCVPLSVPLFPSLLSLVGRTLTAWYDGGRPLLFGGLGGEVVGEDLLVAAVFSLSACLLTPRPRPRGENTPYHQGRTD